MTLNEARDAIREQTDTFWPSSRVGVMGVVSPFVAVRLPKVAGYTLSQKGGEIRFEVKAKPRGKDHSA